ncbi:MAG: DNA-processing protein DprA [Planctomycetota bacterium]
MRSTPAIPFPHQLPASLYPESLATTSSAPEKLFVCGTLPRLMPPAVAVVGSRRASPLGRRQAHELGRQLGEAGLVVVSGLARGIDSCALEGCLRGGGLAGAVLGNGLPTIYPSENEDLATRMIRGGGFVISEFEPDSPPRREHFPQRNRLISALALAVVVVEATNRSGSLITARWALRQGRDVCAFPGPVEGPQYQGCHRLIREGAALVTNVVEVLEVVADLPPHSC